MFRFRCDIAFRGRRPLGLVGFAAQYGLPDEKTEWQDNPSGVL